MEENIAVCGHLAACKVCVWGTLSQNITQRNPNIMELGKNEVMDVLEAWVGSQESLTGHRSQASVGNLLEI